MWYAVCELNTGKLVFLTEEPSDYTGSPLEVIALMRDTRPDPLDEQWDSAARKFTPVPRRIVTHLNFLSRFSSAEYAAIQAARAVSADLDFEWQKFFVAEYIDLDYPPTVAGVTALENAGLIGAGRAAEMLA